MKTSLQMRIQFFTGLFQGFRIECTVHTVHADLSALIPLRVQGYKCKSSLENTSDPCPYTGNWPQLPIILCAKCVKMSKHLCNA